MSSTLTSVLLETEARYTLIASIAEGRKILDFGCLDARGLSILADAEAAEITVICDDPDSINQQLNTLGVEGVELLLETDDPLPFADQVFDIIICHDPEMRLQKDSERLQELRRILCPSGILIVAIANPNGQTLGDLWGEQHSPSSLTYEEGYARLAPLFGNVSAFGQSPMVASLFYDLNSQEEDPGLLFDRSLADEEELPGWYLLFFGSEPIRRDDLNIVQLPLSELKKYTQQQQLDKTIISSSFENDTVSLATTTENTTEINDLEAAKVLIAQLEIERDELALKNDTALEAQAERVAQLRIEADAKVQPLEAEIASLKHRLATSEVESEELNQRFEQQQQERATALTRISELELALDESKGAVAAKELLEQQAELQRQELEMLREQLVQVENARKELEENITATHGNYNEIETAIANERAERSQLETILNDEREEKANLETELQNEKLAKTNLEAALSNLSDEKTKLETALNNERNINANFEALLNNERIETTNLKNLLIQQEQAAAELQNSLENEINQKQELQNSLENEINQKQELQNSLENEINQKQELQNSLENEINQKQELQNSLENEINQKQELQNSLENEINQKQELQDALQQNQKDIGSKNTQIKVLQEETNELRLALEKMQNDIATSQITNNDKSDAINVTETLDNNTDLTLKDTSTISSEEEVVSDELDLVENESTTPVLLDDNANSSIDEEEFSEAVLPLSTSDNVPSNETVSSIELDTEVPNEASVTVNDPAFAQAPEEIENLDAQALLDTAQKNSLDVLYVEDIGETQVLEQNDDTVLNNENTFDEPMFGELKVGSDTVATKKQNPSTLDDLEDLLADSIPKPPSQR